MKSITSAVLGELKPNEQFEDWWESAPIEAPFFDQQKLAVTFLNLDTAHIAKYMHDADQALASFLALDTAQRNALSDLVYPHCMDFLNTVEYDEADKALWDIQEKTEIWKFVYPQEIYLSRRHRRDQDIYISIICECEWEQEHGLQLVFRQGKQLTRISEQDGHLTEADAFNIPDEEDELLSQFQ